MMINHIAGIIYSNILLQLAYTPDLDTLAEARRINNGDGWTFDESLDNKIRGNIIRHEGVRLSDENLMKAHELAMELFKGFYHGNYAEMIENQTHMAYNLGFLGGLENDETDQTYTSI